MPWANSIGGRSDCQLVRVCGIIAKIRQKNDRPFRAGLMPVNNIVNWEGNYIKAPTSLLSSVISQKFSLPSVIYKKIREISTIDAISGFDSMSCVNANSFDRASALLV